VAGVLNDKVALVILAFVAILEAVNVGQAVITGGATLPAVDLLFTTTGGAILTDSLSRRRKEREDPNRPPGPTP
jgi:hypothetical protein